MAAVACRWGFSNLGRFGRFAATHAARFGEPPAKTLQRSA
ncbi:AraC family transcriptional regulator [Mycobacterium kubicae]|nr:helix-turn-helix domain-containing protein [Mycobacterium kubicae]QNI05959.1 AraC family transcriptional regulator [Mycobacterium kubicae]